MKVIINFVLTVGLAVFGGICILNALLQNDSLWGIAAGLVWIAVAHRGRR